MFVPRPVKRSTRTRQRVATAVGGRAEACRKSGSRGAKLCARVRDCVCAWFTRVCARARVCVRSRYTWVGIRARTRLCSVKVREAARGEPRTDDDDDGRPTSWDLREFEKIIRGLVPRWLQWNQSVNQPASWILHLWVVRLFHALIAVYFFSLNCDNLCE